MADVPFITLEACALCGARKPLRESHIIPRFVLEWFLQTSATGHMRFGTAPNLRVQDGMKLRLLCDDCEQRLGVWEKKTAELLFVPYHQDPTSIIEYQEWLGKFCASVAWRALFMFRHLGLHDLTPPQSVAVEQALSLWRDFLLGNLPDPGPFELHLLPVDLVASATFSELPANINRYLARAIEIDVAAGDRSAFVYVKMCRLVLVGFLQMPADHKWEGSRVEILRGVIRPGMFMVPEYFSEYLQDCAKRMARLLKRVSPSQRQRISDTLEANPDRVAESDTTMALSRDIAMFGDIAFENSDDSDTE